MIFEEVQQYNLIKNDVTFTPRTECVRKKDENGDMYADYTIIKSAEEVYKEWLENKDKTIVQEATEEQKLLSTVLLENAEIKEQLKEQQKLSSNLMLQIAQLKGENGNV